MLVVKGIIIHEAEIVLTPVDPGMRSQQLDWVALTHDMLPSLSKPCCVARGHRGAESQITWYLSDQRNPLHGQLAARWGLSAHECSKDTESGFTLFENRFIRTCLSLRSDLNFSLLC